MISNSALAAHIALTDQCSPLEFEVPPVRVLANALTETELVEIERWAVARREASETGHAFRAPVPSALADIEWYEGDEDGDIEDCPPPGAAGDDERDPGDDEIPEKIPERHAPTPEPIPWNGAKAAPERLAVIEGWEDHALVRRALADPGLQKSVRERLERVSEDLSEIAGVETRVREDAARAGTRTRIGSRDEVRLASIEARKRPAPTKGVLAACTRVRALAPELALQATGFRPAPTPEPVSPALDEARALIAAEQAPETPAAPANPRTRAAYLRQLAEESDREASRRRAEADALDPRPEEPLTDLLAPPPDLGPTEAYLEPPGIDSCPELAPRLGRPAGPWPDCDGPGDPALLADQAEDLERQLQERTAERDAYADWIRAVWSALGCESPGSRVETSTALEAIQSLLADRDRQAEDLRARSHGQEIAIGVRDQEIARLRAELAGRPAAQEPAWHAEGRDLVYSAPPPPVLARVEADLDEPIWHWSVGDTIGRRRGTAGSKDDAQAICGLFLRAP